MQVHKRRITQKDRHKIRQTSEFKHLKQQLAKRDGNVDWVSHWNLVEGKTTCHHLDMQGSNYADFSNLENFVLLNESMHRAVHVIYNAYEKDPSVLERLKILLDKMKELNKKDI